MNGIFYAQNCNANEKIQSEQLTSDALTNVKYYRIAHSLKNTVKLKDRI
jgi:hypothetical protein